MISGKRKKVEKGRGFAVNVEILMISRKENRWRRRGWWHGWGRRNCWWGRGLGDEHRPTGKRSLDFN